MVQKVQTVACCRGYRRVSYFLTHKPLVHKKSQKVGTSRRPLVHKKSQKVGTSRKPLVHKKSQKVRHCEKSNSKIAKNCTLYYKSQKSETSRKVKTAKIAKKFTIHYTAVIFQKSTVTQSLRNRGGNITESHTESQYKLEKALRGSKIQKSAIEPLRKMR